MTINTSKKQIKPHPVTPCCNYAAAPHVAYPVMWNPYNKVVQCHNCGAVYTPKVTPSCA